MKVWVTRTEPGASATAARLRALGHDPLVAPLLAIHPLPFAETPPRPGALAFTSRNAVAAIVERPELAEWRTLPVFAVGAATARAAREAGFDDVRSADGDVRALAKLIAVHGGALGGEVLHLCARERAGDLTGSETPVRTLAVYKAIDLALDGAVTAAWPQLNAVLIHSPRAGRAFAAATVKLDASQLLAVCISEAAAEPLRRQVGRVALAEHPTEAAMLARLGNPAPAG